MSAIMSSAARLVFILSALEGNLENQAKSFKPPSLSSIFLINNYHYIAKQIRFVLLLACALHAYASMICVTLFCAWILGLAVCLVCLSLRACVRVHVCSKWHLLPGKTSTERYDTLVKKLREEYKAASWDKALLFLDLSKAKALADACRPTVTNSAKKEIKNRFAVCALQKGELGGEHT
jgi:hypothetical protein